MGQFRADKRFIMQLLNEEDQKPNPVVQRVKTIMIFGLFVVHASRYLYRASLFAVLYLDAHKVSRYRRRKKFTVRYNVKLRSA